jgi:hypothetical protein
MGKQFATSAGCLLETLLTGTYWQLSIVNAIPHVIKNTCKWLAEAEKFVNSQQHQCGLLYLSGLIHNNKLSATKLHIMIKAAYTSTTPVINV